MHLKTFVYGILWLFPQAVPQIVLTLTQFNFLGTTFEEKKNPTLAM